MAPVVSNQTLDPQDGHSSGMLSVLEGRIETRSTDVYVFT